MNVDKNAADLKLNEENLKHIPLNEEDSRK